MHLCGMHVISQRPSMDPHEGRRYANDNNFKAMPHRPAIPKAEGLTEPLLALLCNHFMAQGQTGRLSISCKTQSRNHGLATV